MSEPWNKGKRREAVKQVAGMKLLGFSCHEIAVALNFSPSYVAELSADANRLEPAGAGPPPPDSRRGGPA